MVEGVVALLWKSEGFVFLIDGEVLLLGGFKPVKVNFHSFIIGGFHKGPCFVALFWELTSWYIYRVGLNKGVLES